MRCFGIILMSAIGLCGTSLPAQEQSRAPAVEGLVGYGPAPQGDDLLLGAGILLPVHAQLELRFLGTRVTSGASSAIQIAGLVQWRPGRRAVSPYLAGGMLWRRVALPAGPTDQTDAELGLLGVAGGEARIGSSARFRVFLEGHGILANGYGVEAAGGVRVALGS